MAISGRRTIELHVETTEDGRGLLQAEHEVRRMARGIDDANRRMGHLGHSTHDFNAQIKEARENVRRWAHEMARGGGVDVERNWRNARRELARLERAAKDLLPHAGGKGWFGTGIDFSQGLAESRGILIAGLVGLAVLASPAIGAVVAGAVTGAVGAGGIIGGVVAAAQDPRVKDAFKEAVGSFSAADFGRDIFVGPTIAGIRELKQAVKDMNIGKALAPLAPLVPVLAKGIGDLGRKLMPGLNEAFAHAGPFVDALADGLGDTGAALGDMISDMASSEGSIEGLMMLFDILSGTLRFVGAASRELADVWDFLTDIGQTTADSIANVLDVMGKFPILGAWWKHLGNMARGMETRWREMNQASEDSLKTGTEQISLFHGLHNVMSGVEGIVGAVTNAVDDYNNAIAEMIQQEKDFLDLTMDQDRQAIAWEQAFDDLAASVKENGKSLDIFSEKGRNNRSAILDMIDIARQEFETNQRLGMSFQENTRQLERQIDRIRWHAYHLGLDKKAIDALVKRYILEIQVRTYATGPLAAYINSIFGKGISIGGFQIIGPAHVEAGDFGGSPSPAGFPGMASGGFTGGGAFWAGEHGRELVFAPPGSYVMPHGASEALAGGSGRYVVDVQLNGKTIQEIMIAEALGRGITATAIRVAYP